MVPNTNIFSNLNSNFSNSLNMRNFQEQVKKAFCYQKLFCPFTVWKICSCDLKNFENSPLSASNFKSFSQSLEHFFFLTVGQNNFSNKIPFISWLIFNSLYSAKYASEITQPRKTFSVQLNLFYYYDLKKIFLEETPTLNYAQ